MLSIVSTAIAFLAEVAPGLSTATAVVKAVDQIGALLPVIVKEYKDLVPIVQSTIAALKGNGSVTDDDLAKLTAYEAVIDAEFEAAAEKARAEDEAAGQS